MTDTPKQKMILHIGRHKTGTSSLQQFFAQKASVLAERGILYPETGRKTPHGTLGTAHHEFSQTLLNQPAATVDTLFADLSKEAKGYDIILLSSEDFQNQKDFARLAELFSPYDLTVVCYMREGLGYGLSGFAQRIHFSAEIFNIRQYMERQNIRIAGFIRQWERLADRIVFRLYERDKLKNRDIVDDFLDVIGLDDMDDTTVVMETNPSISGNLLSLKMLMNLMGQSDLVPYVSYEAAARLDPKFTGKIHISDRVAAELRGVDDYNATVKTMFPEMTEPSFEGGAKLFDLSRWDADMDLISTVPEFAFAQALRLGALGQILSNHGLSVDLADADFPTADSITAIRLPDGAQIQQIRERAVAATNDATLARKARADADRAAAKAVRTAQEAMKGRDELAEKLKTRTRKLDKDLAKAAKLSDKMRAEKEVALKTFNTKIEALTSERDAAAAKIKSLQAEASSGSEALKAQLEKVVTERDAARAAQKELSNKMQADSKTTLATFKSQMGEMTEQRDLAVAQMQRVTEARDAAQSESQSVISALRAELSQSAKDFTSARESLLSQRDEAFTLASDREAQLAAKDAQIFYFRGELLRVKNDLPAAAEMFENALKLQPYNETYAARLAQCQAG